MSEHPSVHPLDTQGADTGQHEDPCHAVRRYRSVLDGLQEVVFQTDTAGLWTYLNSSWSAIMGHGVAQSLGTPFLDCVHPDDRARSSALFMQLIGGSKESCGCKLHCVAMDGSLRWIKVSVRSMLDERGAIVGTLGTLTDITQRRSIEERLRLAASVFDGTSEGILITDAQGRIVEVNNALVELTGYAREHMIGRDPSMLSSGRQDKAFYQAMWLSLSATGKWSGEIWNRRADGNLVAEMLRISAVHSRRGEHTHYVAIYSDITDHKRQQEHLERLAHYDMLTALPNRAQALERLDVMMDEARQQVRQVAVCYLDLDGFMEINDQFGHAQGDALLVTASERIHAAVRSGDTVARLGGDEFLLLLDQLSGVAAVHPVLQRVLESLAQPFALEGSVPRVTASVGVALFPDHGDTPEHLLRAADQAMYRAKRLGKNRACMAGDDVVGRPAKAALLEELQLALASQQLCLHYQPKVCARTRAPLGVEALVRWQHPQRGLLVPGAFLPAVVGTPLEVELDFWVVREAVAQLARWRAAGCTLALSINVSPGTLILPELADTVANIVRRAERALGGELAGLELEVLETAALDDLDAASRAIEACARHGISFALDDFGTGYSSLSYLQRLPVSTLKIDRSFVSNMLLERSALHIVRAVIGLAQAFGVTAVAEGVETDEHARLLAELGYHQLQGYGIARPMSAQALQTWLDGCAGSGADLKTVDQ